MRQIPCHHHELDGYQRNCPTCHQLSGRSGNQPCGHSVKFIGDAERGGTYCSECLPDGSQRTYITHNARQVFTHPAYGGQHIVASSPVQALGKVLVSPHGTKEEAVEFADGLEQLPTYVIGPDGDVVYEREVT